MSHNVITGVQDQFDDPDRELFDSFEAELAQDEEIQLPDMAVEDAVNALRAKGLLDGRWHHFSTRDARQVIVEPFRDGSDKTRMSFLWHDKINHRNNITDHVLEPGKPDSYGLLGPSRYWLHQESVPDNESIIDAAYYDDEGTLVEVLSGDYEDGLTAIVSGPSLKKSEGELEADMARLNDAQRHDPIDRHISYRAV